MLGYGFVTLKIRRLRQEDVQFEATLDIHNKILSQNNNLGVVAQNYNPSTEAGGLKVGGSRS